MSKLQYSRNVAFCPKCGGRTLDRDEYRKQPKDGCDFVCRICGFGFRISKSARWNAAEELFRLSRQHAPVKFSTASVGEATANAFLEHLSTEHTRRRIRNFEIATNWFKNKLLKRTT